MLVPGSATALQSSNAPCGAGSGATWATATLAQAMPVVAGDALIVTMQGPSLNTTVFGAVANDGSLVAEFGVVVRPLPNIFNSDDNSGNTYTGTWFSSLIHNVTVSGVIKSIAGSFAPPPDGVALSLCVLRTATGSPAAGASPLRGRPAPPPNYCALSSNASTLFSRSVFPSSATDSSVNRRVIGIPHDEWPTILPGDAVFLRLDVLTPAQVVTTAISDLYCVASGQVGIIEVRAPEAFDVYTNSGGATTTRVATNFSSGPWAIGGTNYSGRGGFVDRIDILSDGVNGSACTVLAAVTRSGSVVATAGGSFGYAGDGVAWRGCPLNTSLAVFPYDTLQVNHSCGGGGASYAAAVIGGDPLQAVVRFDVATGPWSTG